MLILFKPRIVLLTTTSLSTILATTTRATSTRQIMAVNTKASIIEAKQKLEGGGFKVREPLPNKQFRNFDPFLMLHHIGPVDYKPGEAVGAPDHPHRGFETVTYILSGGWEHLDSQSNSGHLGPGWVQWMTAGSGVVSPIFPSFNSGMILTEVDS